MFPQPVTQQVWVWEADWEDEVTEGDWGGQLHQGDVPHCYAPPCGSGGGGDEMGHN